MIDIEANKIKYHDKGSSLRVSPYDFKDIIRKFTDYDQIQVKLRCNWSETEVKMAKNSGITGYELSTYSV